MLILTLVLHAFLAAGVAGQPPSFALDMGSFDSGMLAPPAPAPLPNTTSEAYSPTSTTQMTFSTSFSSATESTAATNSSITAVLNSTTSTACLPTTIVIITLPNPTPMPTPNTETSLSEDEQNLTDDETDDADTPFDTTTDALTKWPHWFTAATFALVFYDLLTLGIFIWLWAFGYLWWFRGRGVAREVRHWRRRGVVSEGGIEMGRMEFGGDMERRREGTSEWIRTDRGYGRVRSESWERRRGQREVELEREMVRLGMI